MITLEMVYNANTYNVAFNYLKAHGYTITLGYNGRFRKLLSKTTKMKEYKELQAKATDSDKEIGLKLGLLEKDFKTSDDYEIYLLVNQYKLGIEPKKDLYNKLISIGLLSI